MENTAAQSENIRRSQNWLPVSMISTFNLHLLIEKMKRSPSWAMGELKSAVLLNKPKKQVVLAVLHRHSEVVSLQSSDSVNIRVIEGGLKLEIKNRAVFINKGSDLTLIEKEKYTLSNREETAYLLTMINKT